MQTESIVSRIFNWSQRDSGLWLV